MYNPTLDRLIGNLKLINKVAVEEREKYYNYKKLISNQQIRVHKELEIFNQVFEELYQEISEEVQMFIRMVNENHISIENFNIHSGIESSTIEFNNVMKSLSEDLTNNEFNMDANALKKFREIRWTEADIQKEFINLNINRSFASVRLDKIKYNLDNNIHVLQAYYAEPHFDEHCPLKYAREPEYGPLLQKLTRSYFAEMYIDKKAKLLEQINLTYDQQRNDLLKAVEIGQKEMSR
ncbi:MAG: hypothetical protein Ta2E_10860 [Mycoplasmoidaceae bacterium]|nr:MAG: hypothetical protein Ta2E_10860 [Mycoplasmoidaceae bacterium]